MKIRCGFRLLVIVVFALAGTVTVCYGPHLTTFDGFGTFDFGSFGGVSSGFFGPGSEPFLGVVELGSSGIDGVITRGLDEMRFGNQLPSTDTIPVEIVELSLTSTQPITVTYGSGSPEDWDVDVTLSDVPAPLGSMTVTRTHCNGGIYDSNLNVQPKFTFTKVEPPYTVKVYDVAQGVPLSRIGTSQTSSWVVESPKDNPPSDGNGFYPTSAVMMQGDGMVLELQPPQPVQVHFLLGKEQDWQDALADGRIHPLSLADGPNYINQFNANLQEGTPYPPTPFIGAELSVLAAGEYSEEAGLLMVWGNNTLPDGNYFSAFQYTYPDDPDLSNTTITVTVDPPCGMSVVSLGMQDQNGNIRAWYWNVAPIAFPAGTISCSPPTTTVSINTALIGVGAATPAAASYSSSAAFSITTVTDITFDENNTFIASVQAPPPGSGQVANWNYWHNLLVTPNTVIGGGGGGGTGEVNSKWFTKWSQPPDVNADDMINGWDELSDFHGKPIMADDWICKDERPVTDIHWWGSFIGWTHPTPPPVVPIGFHIGIWTDVVTGVDKPFSHPGTLVWENYCHTSVWNFAGYDLDPRISDPNWQEDEACFQFAQFLNQDEWFYQDPNVDGTGTGTIYWLSIAAIYSPGEVVTYPWGWKTRPKNYNDDAVRTTGLVGGAWPPVIGSVWDAGTPVEYPLGTSWDLSFELTTNEGLAADFDSSGVVDFGDFRIFAIHWLDVALFKP